MEGARLKNIHLPMFGKSASEKPAGIAPIVAQKQFPKGNR
jgi:hypothetical protein